MKTIPVVKNKEYEVKIDNLGMNGEGIGRIDGFTMFIPGTLPGERVKIKAVKVGKSFGFGKLLEIIKPSIERVEPPCPYAYKCGGCQLQHMSYPLELEFKTQLVKDTIGRIGGLKDVTIRDTIGMEEPWNYRNKMQFPVGLVKGELAIGFYAPRSHNIIDMNSCIIQHKTNDMIIEAVREFMNIFNIPPYDELNHKGIVRHIVSKVGFKSKEVMIMIVTNGSYLPKTDELVKLLRNKIPGTVSILQNINSKKTNVVLGKKTIVLWGKDHIVDWIGDLKFKISPLSFFQVNPVQTVVLYDKTVEFADLTGDEVVIDAYCGIGTISLYMARKAKRVYGIEMVPQAIDDAIINASQNNIKNVEFIVGQAEVVVPKMIEQGQKVDVVVVDPPRKGCDSRLLDALVKAQPDRMVYVSCNPATLARDLKYLSDRGYRATEIQPVDMFPQTSHVETVVLMSRIEN